MADTLTKAERSALMAKIRGTNTKPEVLVRSALHRAGLRFRLHAGALPGRPDIVLAKHRTAIFVHGCFWHRHGCRLSSEPSSRRAFWREKFARNVARDRRAAQALRRAGWRVLTIWECSLRTAALRERALARLVRAVLRDAHRGGQIEKRGRNPRRQAA
jgi:DNA mismatch endonuclease (patch repair protein)